MDRRLYYRINHPAKPRKLRIILIGGRYTHHMPEIRSLCILPVKCHMAKQQAFGGLRVGRSERLYPLLVGTF
jgi:hypothetical protein